VAFENIPAGGSCSSVCGSFEMACVGRFSDAPGDACANFAADINAEPCDATGDTDDVCVCGVASPLTAAACAPLDGLLGPTDVVCGGSCDGIECTCAVRFASIPDGGSCTSACAAAGMACAGRHSDAAGDACAFFRQNTFVESCDATGDGDDVCVCSYPDGPPTTAPPTESPTTAPPTPVTGCSSIIPGLGAEDEICAEECDTTTVGTCTCAVYWRDFDASESCTSLCAAVGMQCITRFADGPGGGQRCNNFAAGLLEEPCDATGDTDDVCVCGKPSGLLGRL